VPVQRALALAVLLLVAGPALADEPHGCDKFAWSIEDAQHRLIAAQPPGSGPLDRDAGRAVLLSLAPLAKAGLKLPPERAPKDPASFAGLVEFKSGAAAGTYAVTLSAGAWIDVIQDGKFLKPAAFTGALDCASVRKSVKFALAPDAFTIQVSSARADSIGLVVTPSQ